MTETVNRSPFPPDRTSHRAAVEAGYASLPGYIERWGKDPQASQEQKAPVPHLLHTRKGTGYMTPEEARVRDILCNVRYPGMDFHVMTEGGRCYLRVHNPQGVCTVTSEDLPWNGRWWRLSPHMTPSEIVSTAFKAVITALEHEARESFLYRGVPVYDAHLDVEQLADLRSDRSALDARG